MRKDGVQNLALIGHIENKGSALQLQVTYLTIVRKLMVEERQKDKKQALLRTM